jgi:hypothetical protein
MKIVSRNFLRCGTRSESNLCAKIAAYKGPSVFKRGDRCKLVPLEEFGGGIYSPVTHA